MDRIDLKTKKSDQERGGEKKNAMNTRTKHKSILPAKSPEGTSRVGPALPTNTVHNYRCSVVDLSHRAKQLENGKP